MNRPQIDELSQSDSNEGARNASESGNEEALPDGWAFGSIKDTTTKVGSGATPKGGKAAYKASGTPLIRSMNVHFEEFNRDGLAFIDDDQAAALDGVTVNANDTLLNITGASIGRVSYVPDDLAKARVNQHVCILRLVESFSQDYLRFYLSSPAIQNQISGEEYGVTRPALTKGQVLSFQIPWAPLAEQSRIVSAIESLQTRSSRARELLSEVGPLIGQLRQSVLRDAFSGKLTADWRRQNPAADGETARELLLRIRTERRERWQSEQLAKYEAKGKKPPKNWQDKYKEPDGILDADALVTEFNVEKTCNWEVAPLELLVDPEKSIPYGIVKTGDPYRNGVPTVRCGDIKRFSIAITDLKLVNPDVHRQYRRTYLQGGEVIIAIRGTVGETAVVPAEMKGMNISREVALIPVLSGVDATFLMYLLACPAAKRLITGQVKGVAQSGINLSDLRMLPIPLPSLEEQHEIARRITQALEMLDNISAVESSIENSLTHLDQSILSKAFRGELVPQDPRDEPASELLARIRQQRQTTKTKRN
ncbi:restriction endonuclease subunit S [Allorhodopirellula solitaria]|uniref:Type-1 restriction enzyme EcoKI specificity protein n=1 Tax=Allorhodopirellula solitaria TaxID=2527987 RepID=A0A5C5X0Z0_9BACT|nr:restriction endonuclease subunit S [Allorhodopirellula solitaria]TWT56470.1 Type-1 restriction enzyme EcoKI specificity protein [Allorhodopirellula solitaria]